VVEDVGKGITYLSTRKMVEVVAKHWVDITMEELTQGLKLLRLLCKCHFVILYKNFDQRYFSYKMYSVQYVETKKSTGIGTKFLMLIKYCKYSIHLLTGTDFYY
jgi:hypothetical protein